MVGRLFQKDFLVIGKEVYMRCGNAVCESHRFFDHLDCCVICMTLCSLGCEGH